MVEGCKVCGRMYSEAYARIENGSFDVCTSEEHQAWWQMEAEHARREANTLRGLLQSAFETIRKLRGLK